MSLRRGNTEKAKKWLQNSFEKVSLVIDILTNSFTYMFILIL